MTYTPRYLALWLLLCGPTLCASAESAKPDSRFADSMILCNSQALFYHLYSQGTPMAGVPKPLDYRELAYQSAGKAYVDARLEERKTRDEAMKQIEVELNTQRFEGLSEAERESHMTAAWSKIITACNQLASAASGMLHKK
ncbi:MAG: hypothetical protein RR779_00595 [Comamonas sp.]